MHAVRLGALILLATWLTGCSEPGGTRGVDVSHWQGEVDWPAVAADGIDFAIVKATEGVESIDRRFAANWSGAARSGLVRGAYHFLLPGHDGAAQARHFLRTVRPGTGDLRPVVDVETPGPDLAKVLKDFLAEIRRSTGTDAIIYVSPSFWNDRLAADFPEPLPNPLWIAEYGVASPRATTRLGPWAIWQHDRKGRIEGIDGDVDLDRARDLAGLRLP